MPDPVDPGTGVEGAALATVPIDPALPVQQHPSPRSPWLRRGLGHVCGLYRSYDFSARVVPPDPSALLAHWMDELSGPDVRNARSEAISRAYDGANNRGTRIEAKAIGYLQVLALGFAVVTLVLTRDSMILRLVSLAALLFLSTATWGALDVLRVRSRQQVLARDATSVTGGLAEAATAAACMEIQHIRSSNFISGAAHDLAIGGLFALASLVLMVFGVGSASGQSNDPGPTKQPVVPLTIEETTSTSWEPWVSSTSSGLDLPATPPGTGPEDTAPIVSTPTTGQTGRMSELRGLSETRDAGLQDLNDPQIFEWHP